MKHIFKIEKFPADEPFDIPDDATIVDIRVSFQPLDSRDWFDVKYMLPLPSDDDDEYSIAKWCDGGRHWATSLFPLTSGRPLIMVCAFCGKTLQSSAPTAKKEVS